ncbi:ABC transporter ATP-binding protein [Aquipuribacter sp. MA13-6]|uniref:ABC transporter ATP-binding protein n=1 Tax=unclassified Aquipuribacter TaxID=2635084 RepID=UPI003EE8955E
MTTMDRALPRIERDRPLRSALRLFRAQRWRLLVAAGAFALKHSPVWVMPLLTANVIDMVVEEQPLSVLWLNAAVMTVLIVQNVPLTSVYAKWSSTAVRTVETDLRAGLCHRLQQLSIGYHRRMSAGVLQAKVVRDVETVVDATRQVLDSGLAAVTTLAGAIALTAWRVPEFLPVFLVAVPAAALLVQAMKRRMTTRNAAFRHEVEQLSAAVSEMTHLIPVTRAHALESRALERIDGSLAHVRREGVRLDVLNGRFNAVAWVLFQLLSVACLVTAAWAARTGAIPVSAGDVVLLSTYFVALTGSVTMLMNLAPQFSKGLESVRSMAEVLGEADVERNEGKAVVDRVEGRIRLRGVRLRYDDSEDLALDGLDLDVAAGETVALVGPSGSGKSTVLNLVVGFLHPQHGAVLVDGQDLTTLDLRSYRRHLAVVPQEALLFEGTVRDNVAHGLDLDESSVAQALKDANAWDFVTEMGGPDAWVGQRGARLSGGQRQRLTIARALARDPRVLVLDEATSALDRESEAAVQEALQRLMAGRTTLVVAHRLSTVRSADRIVVLRAGQVAEQGSHGELLAAGGLYAHLDALDRAEPVS